MVGLGTQVRSWNLLAVIVKELKQSLPVGNGRDIPRPHYHLTMNVQTASLYPHLTPTVAPPRFDRPQSRLLAPFAGL